MKWLLNLMLVLSSFYGHYEVFTTADKEDVSEFFDDEQTVIEIDEGKYKQGITFTKDLFLLKHNYDYHITKVIGKDENSYFLIGRVDTGYYPFRTENLSEFPYLAYYENEELVWEKVFTDWGYGVFNDAIIDDNNIIAIGHYETATATNKIVIVKMSANGVLKDKILLGGTKNSEGHHLFMYQDRYYFAGFTFANDGDFITHESSNQNIVVGFVDKKNFQIKETRLSGNNGNNRLFGAEMHNGNLYLYVQFAGDGYFIDDNGETNFRALVCYDNRLEYQNHIPLGNKYLFKKSKLILAQDKLAIISKDYWDDGLTFSFYDWELNFINEMKLKLSYNEGEFYDYAIEIGDYITICCNMKQNGSYHYKYMILTSDWQIVHQATKPSTHSHIPVSIYLIDRIIYCGSMIENNGYQQPHLESYLHIKISDSAVMFNGIYLPSKALTTPSNQDMFGKTTNLYAYYSGDYIFVLPYTTEVPVRINISNKGVYDCGLTLDFNGLGYLNDERIDSGYICSEEGVYLLELQGNDQTLYYTFTVKKKSLNQTDIMTRKNIDIERKEKEEKPVETDKITIHYQEQIPENETYYVYILLSLAVIGVIIGLVIPQRRKKNG